MLAFVPVRGAILLLHAFRAGVWPGVLAGVVDGLLVCAWVRGVAPTHWMDERACSSRSAGALAAASIVAGTLASAAVAGRMPAVAAAAVAFEIGAGGVRPDRDTDRPPPRRGIGSESRGRPAVQEV